MWRLAAGGLVTLVAYPLALAPSKPVAIAGALALLVSGAGLVLRWTPAVTAGVALALGEYAVALMVSAGAPGLGSAVVVGALVMLVLETADFDRRFRRVTLGAGVLASQLRHWAGSVALGAGAAVLIVAGASVVMAVAWIPWAPVLAAVGALGAVVAVAAALRRTLGAA